MYQAKIDFLNKRGWKQSQVSCHFIHSSGRTISEYEIFDLCAVRFFGMVKAVETLASWE
jgi:hypothetical protein